MPARRRGHHDVVADGAVVVMPPKAVGSRAQDYVEPTRGRAQPDRTGAVLRSHYRRSGRRATVSGTDLRERAVGYQGAILATEWRIRHDRQIVMRAPRSKVTLNTSAVEAVRNLIGRTAIAVGNTEEIFHLVNVKVGDAPSFDFPRRA